MMEPEMTTPQLWELYRSTLKIFQRRYVLAVQCQCSNKPCITWYTISKLRKAVNKYGGMLIERNELDILQHIHSKGKVILVTDDQRLIRPEQLDAMREKIKFHHDK